MNVIINKQSYSFSADELDSRATYKKNTHVLRMYPQKQLVEDERRQGILKLNGIQTSDSSNRRIKQRYRFYICHFNCFRMLQNISQLKSGSALFISQNSRLAKQKWRRISRTKETREIEKAKKLAYRALYCLGYDIGMVEVTVYFRKPKYIISNISAINLQSEKVEEELNNCLNQQLKQFSIKSSNAVLGADIEFVLRHTSGRYVLASSFLPKKGNVGHDAIWIRGHRQKHPLGELRPDPTEDPLQLYKHIKQCMKKGIATINRSSIQWLAGGKPLKGFPIGGHIHFSQLTFTSKLLRALDNYLTLPLFLLESKESLSRRPKYGFIGDYRAQFHGGFEYRTPPSWIVSPEITKAVLCLAKVISNDYNKLVWMPLNLYSVQAKFYSNNKDDLYAIGDDIWSELKKRCPSYEKYEATLDQFYSFIRNKYEWNEYDDIRKTWKLPPY